MVIVMLNIYVGKNLVKVDESNLLDMDINVLKSIPYSVACKYKDYIAALEVCIEDCLDVDRKIHDETSYVLALSEIETIMEDDDEEDFTTVNNNSNNKEEKVMMGTVRGNMDAAVEEMKERFAEAKENIKVNAGETKEEYFERVDDSLNVMKGALGNVLNVLDETLGYTVLKHSIIDIMETGSDGKTSAKSLFKMAKRCRELIEEEIENLEFWGDEESLKKATQLKALTEGVRGKSIFEAFASGCIWIAKKVTRKLRVWFHVDDEKSVIGNICRSISGFASILRAGVELVWSTTKFAVSFVIAGAIKIASFVFNAIKSLVVTIKNYASEKFAKCTEDDVEDDFIDDEDFMNDEQ